MKRLGILLSGRGSNFLAIAKAISEHRLLGAKIAVVHSNREDAGGLETARELKIPAFCVPSAGRKRADHEAMKISPVQLIIAGVIGAALFVTTLLLVVHFVLGRAGAGA